MSTKAKKPTIKTPDQEWSHLFPPFRKALDTLLREAAKATGSEWYLFEGIRSQDRQTYLYSLGRRGRAGEKIVTKMRTPVHHGAGLAADVLPKGQDWNAPASHWVTLRDIYRRMKVSPAGAALENPAWSFGDQCHVQWPAADKRTHLQAAAWVRAGFPETQPAPKPANPMGTVIRTFLDLGTLGEVEEVPDADAYYYEPGRVAVAVRPLLDSLGWSIIAVKGGVATIAQESLGVLKDPPTAKAREVLLPLIIREEPGGDRGYVRAQDFGHLTVLEPRWDAAKKQLTFYPDPSAED